MLAGIIAYNEFYIVNWKIIQSADAFIPYWYIPVSVGVILLALAIGIRKPVDDSGEE